ncbi:hypothetical protein [Leptolyngbya iicbica]|uniref:Uncharacterized protein n=2 Tax=Cyanophyceae TaxID=3028117 RepID=A0A4Q7EA10_9CYAN|nr:hypothetical protein [Leptolyngbya sp. LK]RZM79428.1 hypothetical protein DYY88_11845 [Leptolyngbya sp. LK]
MWKQSHLLMGIVGGAAVVGLLQAPVAIAQTNANQEFFQGRGVAQGSVFARGRNANVLLTLDGENFRLEMTEPQASSNRNRAPSRVEYRGVITRRNAEPGGQNNFVLLTRVRSFDSSETLRVISNTAGTCRLEVFDARIVDSNCSTVTDNSSTRFLGVEQF